jgi:hypothetical protein
VPNVTTGKTLPSGFYFFKSMLPSITDGTGRGCFHTLETAYLCGATTLWKPDSGARCLVRMCDLLPV